MLRNAAVLAAIAVVLLGVADVQGSNALDRPGVIRITNSLVKHTTIDKPPRGTSLGDLDYRRVLLYNKRIQAKALGHGEMVCTIVTGSTQSCDATYFLPRGELVVSGVISSRLIYVLAVIGGTDLYNNVRGTLTVTSLRRAPARDLLVFRLTV